MLRQGSGEPLLLYHGLMGSEAMWQDVVPLLADDYDVIAPTALGHRGGAAAVRSPTPHRDVVDDAERQLDSWSIERAHLVGNSMGGWTALELARRGRALSVCVLSPAGMWDPGGAGRAGRTRRLRSSLQMGRAGRHVWPLAYRSRFIRGLAMENVAADGRSIPRARALAMTRDMLGCAIAEDLLDSDEYFPVLDPLPCPVAVVWSQLDRLFPEGDYGRRARARLPAASYEVMPAVGHVPMLDASRLVAQTIRRTIATPAPAAD